jgi:hypothetical protein
VTNLQLTVPKDQAQPNAMSLKVTSSVPGVTSAMKTAADTAQLLVTDPICTGQQTTPVLATIQSMAGNARMTACKTRVEALCKGPNPPMPYCSCVLATPLMDNVNVGCLAANDCHFSKFSTMWVPPEQLVDPCGGANITICSVLPQLSAHNITLANDKINVQCGSQFSKCATCTTGVGECVSETDPTVCRPSTNGQCGTGWKRCNSTPSDPTKPPTDPTKPPTDPTKPPTDPTKPQPQPWWGIFTNSSPLLVDGKNLGTIGHWVIGGVVAAGVVLLLILVYVFYLLIK